MEGNYMHKDRTEVTKERNVTEEEGTTNGNKRDRGEVKCFLKVEDTLNSLFSGIQKSKKQLHSDMEALRGGILQTIRDDKENKDCILALKTEKLELEKQIKVFKSEAFELQKTLKESQKENIKLEGEVGDLKNEIQKSKSLEDRLIEKLQKSKQEKGKLSMEYAEYKKDVEDQMKKLREISNKSVQEKEKITTDNTKLKKDLEDQMKRYEILDRQLRENLQKSQQEKDKFSMDKTKLKKDLEDQTKKSDLLMSKLKEDLAESLLEKEELSKDNSKLKKSLEDQMKRSELVDQESRGNSDEYQQEGEKLTKDNSELKKIPEDQIRSVDSDQRPDSFDSKSWENVTLDSNAELKNKSSHETDKAKEDTGKDKLGCQNEIEEKEIEEKAKDLMENLYTSSWMEIYASLMREKVIDDLTAQDILYRTLWYCYQLMLDTKTKQPEMSATNSNFPHTPESEVLNNTVPESAQGSMAGVKPEDSLIKVLEEKLMESLNKEYKEYMEYLNRQPKFARYVTDCLQSCHYLVFNSNRLYLKSHKLNINIDEKFFTKYTGHEKGRVCKVIFPALILLKEKEIITLRKGIVNTTLTPYHQS